MLSFFPRIKNTAYNEEERQANDELTHGCRMTVNTTSIGVESYTIVWGVVSYLFIIFAEKT